MKKSILIIALILGFHSAQAQRQLDTSDLFEGMLYQVINDAPRPKVFIGSGKFDHRHSIGKLKYIFNDSGESFREIFGQMAEEFPGVVYANDMDVPHIKLEDYFRENIKDHCYDSLRYSVSVPYYDKYDGRSILIEREKIDCYFYGKSRERFIQITRFDGEIVSVLDDAPELGMK
jgi:hypothetical protein